MTILRVNSSVTETQLTSAAWNVDCCCVLSNCIHDVAQRSIWLYLVNIQNTVRTKSSFVWMDINDHAVGNVVIQKKIWKWKTEIHQEHHKEFAGKESTSQIDWLELCYNFKGTGQDDFIMRRTPAIRSIRNKSFDWICYIEYPCSVESSVSIKDRFEFMHIERLGIN